MPYLILKTIMTSFGHPVYGASWEGFILESIIAKTPEWRHSFYRPASGVKLDLIMEKRVKVVSLPDFLQMESAINPGTPKM